MLAYEFHSLRKDSFPNNALYEKTFDTFEQIFSQQVALRQRLLHEIVSKIFTHIKTRSGNTDSDEFELVPSGGEGIVPGGHIIRFTASVQQIFEVPLFEVDYAFTRWNLENRIMNHYTYHGTAAYNPLELFPDNSVRVKVFAKGAMLPIIEEEFKKHEKDFEKIGKGFAMQIVES
jgi:hypothetical protein